MLVFCLVATIISFMMDVVQLALQILAMNSELKTVTPAYIITIIWVIVLIVGILAEIMALVQQLYKVGEGIGYLGLLFAAAGLRVLMFFGWIITMICLSHIKKYSYYKFSIIDYLIIAFIFLSWGFAPFFFIEYSGDYGYIQNDIHKENLKRRERKQRRKQNLGHKEAHEATELGYAELL